ncbi:hypothetical protein LCGC14_2101490 [marine sediment metagenome]|uniref:Uncharacterized protein n=1 Tax=marine sediment metagenome TaxID=412755 RepID=A0A0F9E9P6_9ZZZZ
MGRKETIRIACIVPPDGRVAFIEADQDGIRNAWQKWRDSLNDEQIDAHEAAKTQGGVVLIDMLKTDYDGIFADNRHWISQ